MLIICFRSLFVFLVLLRSSQGQEQEMLNPPTNQAAKQVNISSPLETNDATLYKGDVQVFLPTLELEYVCGHDIRPTFHTTETFQDLYQTLLPDMTEPHLTHIERISGMDHILNENGKNKLKFWGCDATSTEVLMTFKVKGFAFFNRSSDDIAAMNEVVNHNSVRHYFVTNVCSDLSQFRVFVESPFRKESKSNEFDKVQHHLSLLCSGASGNYFAYEDDHDDDDPIFVLFGVIVGYYMVRMVVIEQQKYGRNRIRRNYEGLPSEEVEMM